MSEDLNHKILEKLNAIDLKIELCCGNYDNSATKIQSAVRGNISRRDTRRTMRPNITQSLSEMPGDFDAIIRRYQEENMKKSKNTKGWTIFKHCDSFPHHNKPGIMSFNSKEELENVKKHALENNYCGFTHIIDGTCFFREYGTEDCLMNILKIRSPEYQKLNSSNFDSNFYLRPGASFLLIKQKIDEGFEVEFEDNEDRLKIEKMIMGSMEGGRKRRKSKRKLKKKPTRKNTKKKSKKRS